MLAHPHMLTSIDLELVPRSDVQKAERYLVMTAVSISLLGVGLINIFAASELRSALTGAVLVLLGITLGGIYKLTRALVGVATLWVKVRMRKKAIEAGVDPAEFDRMWEEGTK